MLAQPRPANNIGGATQLRDRRTRPAVGRCEIDCWQLSRLLRPRRERRLSCLISERAEDGHKVTLGPAVDFWRVRDRCAGWTSAALWRVRFASAVDTALQSD